MKRLLAALLLATTPLHAQSPDLGAFLAGHFAASQGALPQAADQMLKALQADPGNEQLRRDTFAVTLLAGRPEAARIGATLRGNPIAELLNADEKVRAGDWRGAELGYAELPKGPLTDALRPMLVAWTQLAQGETDRALETLAGDGSDSKSATYYRLHAALIADIGHRDGLAEQLYSDVARSMSQQNLRMTQLLASWQARSGHPDRARATIQALADSAPELAICVPGLLASMDHAQIANARQGIAEAYAGVAGGLRGDGHVTSEGPALLLQLAALMQPGLTESALVRSEMEVRQNHFAAAAAALAAVPDSDPLAPIVRLRQANDLARAGRGADAIPILNRLAEAFPDRTEALVQLGGIDVDAKDYADAVAAYDRAIARVKKPGQGDWYLFFARGAALERSHDWPRAEADMQQALKLEPDQPSVLNFLGYSWTEQNHNLPEARRMIQRALDQRPEDGAIVDSLGWVMLRQGEVREAVHVLERAAEMAPDDAAVTGHLGDAYWEAGRKTEAQDQWRRALVLNPEPEDRSRIEARLKSATSAP